MKKWLSLFLVLATVLSLGSITATAATPDGSEANPYLASTKAEISAAFKNITAGSANNHIKLTADITVTDWWQIGDYSKEIVLDLNGHTITSNDSVDFDCGTLKNGIITSDAAIAFRVGGNTLDSTVYLENLEIVSTRTSGNAYAVRFLTANVVMTNCKITASHGTGILMVAQAPEIQTANPPAVEYTATLSQVDITATTGACSIDNQPEDVSEPPEPDYPTLYAPHAYYTVTINGETVSDVNAGETVTKSGNVVGGYDDSWKTGNDTLSISHTVAEPSYTVTIPATVTLGNTAEVKIEDAVCPHGYEVKVTLSGTSGEGNAYTLENAVGDSLTYTVTKDNADLAVGDTVVTASTGDETATLSFNEPATTPAPGDYTGTVTFTVSWDLK